MQVFSPLPFCSWKALTASRVGAGSVLTSPTTRTPWLTDLWQLFIVEGVLTIGIAIILAILMPSGPASAFGLTDNEREYALWNLRKDIGKNDDRHEITAVQGFKLVVKDPKTWLLMGVLHATYVAAAVVSFFPSVVKTLGYSRSVFSLVQGRRFKLTGLL